MKLFLTYLRQKRRAFAAFILFAVLFLISFILFRLPTEAVLYPAGLCAAAGAVFIACDFIRVKQRHDALARIKSITDAIEVLLPKTESIEEADYKSIIRLISDEHSRYRTYTNREYSDMVDYYTVWAHQIKTPIASMRLNLQSEDSPLSRRILSDLYRIEQYADMVLAFLRLNSQSTDYVIKEYELDKILKQAIKSYSHEFISRRLALVYEPTDAKVITDEKWLLFVIEQILSNALKYTKSGTITVSVDSNKQLTVSDTGMGIAPQDLPRIFENGFTGFNGRIDKKASGIGLYLCKRICTALGHGIRADSEVGKGTVITVDLKQTKPKFE